MTYIQTASPRCDTVCGPLDDSRCLTVTICDDNSRLLSQDGVTATTASSRLPTPRSGQNDDSSKLLTPRSGDDSCTRLNPRMPQSDDNCTVVPIWPPDLCHNNRWVVNSIAPIVSTDFLAGGECRWLWWAWKSLPGLV